MGDEEPRGAVGRAAGALRRQMRVLRLVWKDPRTPWYARAVAGATVAYLASPIDLIPDFLPVIGHLDDALIVPAGLWLAFRLVPREVVEDARRAAELEEPSGQCAGPSAK